MYYSKPDFFEYAELVIGLGQGFSGSNFRGLSLLRSGLVRLRRITPLMLMPRLKPGL